MTTVGSGAVGTAGLAVILALSALVSRARPFPPVGEAEQRRLLLVGSVAWVVQAAHFTEELLTDFSTAFPRTLGLSPWSRSSFAVFNVAWLLVWVAALSLAPRGHRSAEWPLWFLAMALTVNGIAHLALAVQAEGYFPGLWTAIPAGVAGLLLLSELLRLTQSVAA